MIAGELGGAEHREQEVERVARDRALRGPEHRLRGIHTRRRAGMLQNPVRREQLKRFQMLLSESRGRNLVLSVL